MQVLFIYITISFTSDVILLSHKSDEFPRLTLAINSLFTVLEYILFSYIIYFLLKSKIFKFLLILVGVLFLAFTVFEYFNNVGNQHFDSMSVAIECIILIIFCVIYFYEQIDKPEIILIYESYSFWAISGIMLYLAGGLFLYIFVDSLPKQEKHSYWNIIHTVNIVKNIFFSIAFFMKKEKLIYSSNTLSWN